MDEESGSSRCCEMVFKAGGLVDGDVLGEVRNTYLRCCRVWSLGRGALNLGALRPNKQPSNRGRRHICNSDAMDAYSWGDHLDSRYVQGPYQICCPWPHTSA